MLNILVIFFVPKFEPIFEKLKEKGELPALTTFLMAFSHFLQTTGRADPDRGWRSSAFVCFRALGASRRPGGWSSTG